jgi:hypothetical protein
MLLGHTERLLARAKRQLCVLAQGLPSGRAIVLAAVLLEAVGPILAQEEIDAL